MRSELIRELFSLIEAQVASRPSPVEYEMAYQARVAMDRIRFAITQIEKVSPSSEGCREAALELLDAVDRLKAADRKFQTHFRRPRLLGLTTDRLDEEPNGSAAGSSPEPT